MIKRIYTWLKAVIAAQSKPPQPMYCPEHGDTATNDPHGGAICYVCGRPL